MTRDGPPVRVLAVDFGERRTGLAATDPTGSIVSPLETLVGLDLRDCAAAVAALARDRRSEVIVIGLPLAARGEIGHRARRTLEFVEATREAADCAVETVDESHTTDEAHHRLTGMKAARRKRYADSVAAVVILERFLAEGGRPPAE